MRNQGILPFQMDLDTLASVFPVLIKDTTSPISITDDGYQLDVTVPRNIVFSGDVRELILPSGKNIGSSFVIHNSTSHDVNVIYTYKNDLGVNTTVTHTINKDDTWVIKWDGKVWIATDLNYEEIVKSSGHVLTPINSKIVTFDSNDNIQMTLQNGGTVGIELEFFNKGSGKVDLYYNGNSLMQFPGECKHFGTLKWDGEKWLNITKDEWVISSSQDTPIKKDIPKSNLHVMSSSRKIYLANPSSDVEIRINYEDEKKNLEDVSSRDNVEIVDYEGNLITDLNETNNSIVLKYDTDLSEFAIIESAKVGKITTVEEKFITGIRNNLTVSIEIPDSIISKHKSPYASDPSYPTADPGYGKYWSKNLNKIILIRSSIVDLTNYGLLKTKVFEVVSEEDIYTKQEDIILTSGEKATLLIINKDADISPLYEYYDDEGNFSYNSDINLKMDIYGDTSLPFESTTLFNGLKSTVDVLSELETLLGEVAYYEGVSNQVYNSPLWVAVDYASEEPDLKIKFHKEVNDSSNIPVGTTFNIKNNSKYAMYFTLDLIHPFSGEIHDNEHHVINAGEINSYIFNGFDFVRYEQSTISPVFVAPNNGKMLSAEEEWAEFSAEKRSNLKIMIRKGSKFEITNRFGKTHVYSAHNSNVVIDLKDRILHPNDWSKSTGYKFGGLAYINSEGKSNINETRVSTLRLGATNGILSTGYIHSSNVISGEDDENPIDLMGTDMFVYLCAGDGLSDAISDVKLIASPAIPAMFQILMELGFGETVCTQCIGGFHIGTTRITDENRIPLKVSGETWGGNDTDVVEDGNYFGKNVTVGIISNSVWDLSHRPKCFDIENHADLVGGMAEVGHIWFDIYSSCEHYSGGGAGGGDVTGMELAKTSVYGGRTQSNSGNLFNDILYGARIGKRLPSMSEWFMAAMGSPQASADGKYGTVNTGSVGNAGCGLNPNGDSHVLGIDGVKPFAVSAFNLCDCAGLMGERTSEISIVGSENSTSGWGWTTHGPVAFGYKNTPYTTTSNAVCGGSNADNDALHTGSRAFAALNPLNTASCVGTRYCCDSTV